MMFLLLIVARRLHLARDSQKQRDGELRQRLGGMSRDAVQQGRLDMVGREDDGRTAGAAVVMRQFDAVHVRFVDERVRAQGFGDFGCGDVFGLPAEGVADAVVEEPAAVFVPADDVAGAEPGVALAQDVAHDFAVRGLGVVEVALEFGADVGGVDSVEEFARGAAGDFVAEIGAGVADRLFGFPVELDDGDLRAQQGAGDGAVAADGAGGEVVRGQIPRAGGAFGGGVEFADGGDAEAVFESVPNVRAEAVAECDADFVFLVEVFAGDGVELRGRGEEVAAGFPDVLDDGGVGVSDFFPEGFGGEFVADDDGAAY